MSRIASKGALPPLAPCLALCLALGPGRALAEEAPPRAGETPDLAEEKADLAEETPDLAEEKAARIEETPNLAGEAPYRGEEQPDRVGDAPGWEYLLDGGAVPFIYGTGAVALGAALFLTPPDSPRLFSAAEGGAERRPETVPTLEAAIAVAAAPVAVGLLDSEARWFHVKGMTQTLLTTVALTEIAKNTFGRRRPLYDPETSTSEDDRKSFFSGHASVTVGMSTYLGLYLHEHVFSRWRDPDQSFAWWETLPLAGLTAAAVYVPYTRVADHRHHLSDVLTGAGVGASLAIGFYVWQDRRFHREQRRARPRIRVAPAPGGLAISGEF